ncbi:MULTISPECIES: aminoacyl-tRNA deacylase [unclassified Rathayibacter]|uniref:aminoacyl-tRNA deacylase n=1 Tax=unclassified Rathayibacter TaxID=2609250 RepID=UPI00188A0C6D|nr:MULTISPECIES: YbaK/EbsC family protein [unclassified Rathayibacter]MBF4462066.1 YbaK/EbsC family protein [Rathayibacter sp. VKM Ac-2879]MBF4503891.1 YbaK/EbsC family protein [Rathayibacter sp. VKM Ac-2878]
MHGIEPVEEGLERFAAEALARGLDVEVVERPEAGSLQEAAELLGVEHGELVKSLVVARHGGGFLFALVPGGRQIAWPKLRAVVGVNRLRLPDETAAFDATGYRRGTITPIGSTTAWPVYADERILGRRIAMGAGAAGRSAFVDADALVAAYGATVANITVEESPR